MFFVSVFFQISMFTWTPDENWSAASGKPSLACRNDSDSDLFCFCVYIYFWGLGQSRLRAAAKWDIVCRGFLTHWCFLLKCNLPNITVYCFFLYIYLLIKVPGRCQVGHCAPWYWHPSLSRLLLTTHVLSCCQSSSSSLERERSSSSCYQSVPLKGWLAIAKLKSLSLSISLF